jgi:hypothetical protein
VRWGVLMEGRGERYSTSSWALEERMVRPLNVESMLGRRPRHFDGFLELRKRLAARDVGNVMVAVETEALVVARDMLSPCTPEALQRSFLVVVKGIPLMRMVLMVRLRCRPNVQMLRMLLGKIPSPD